MIEVTGLSKAYGEILAVDEVSFRAEPGQVFGLLGPNGAGKSTTIACICGLQRPSRGRVEVLGYDITREPRAAKTGLGVVPQELAIYEELNARDNVAFWAAAYGLRGSALSAAVEEALDRVQLGDRRKEAVKRFSGGMQRRLNFACGIVHRPKVLLLDEPTVGVDPQSRARLLELVRELADSGTTVLYTTHYMEEAESLCDRLAIIDHGRLLAVGGLDDLRGKADERDIVLLRGTFDAEKVASAFAEDPSLELRGSEAELCTVACRGASRRLPDIYQIVERAGGEIAETTMRTPSLETLFLELTGREMREA